MKYLFCIVYLLFSMSFYLFAGDGPLIYCKSNRGGYVVMNCKKDEDCFGKKELYSTDIECGIAKVFGVMEDNIYVALFQVPQNFKKNYIFKQSLSFKEDKDDERLKILAKSKNFMVYLDRPVHRFSYFEFMNGEFKERRTLYFALSHKLKNFDDFCLYVSYEIDGQPVEFNESLKGKDPVYDWVMKNMPKNRPNAKYIDFGPDIDSSQFTIY